MRTHVSMDDATQGPFCRAILGHAKVAWICLNIVALLEFGIYQNKKFKNVDELHLNFCRLASARKVAIKVAHIKYYIHCTVIEKLTVIFSVHKIALFRPLDWQSLEICENRIEIYQSASIWVIHDALSLETSTSGVSLCGI